jgi:hypothetical protein
MAGTSSASGEIVDRRWSLVPNSDLGTRKRMIFADS